jgi:sec-independent protein translocase protein TatB
MFGIGGTEIIVILIVALLFLGPDKLPQTARQISKGIRDIKKQSRSLQQQIESDEQIGGAIRDLKSALRGDDMPPPRVTRNKLTAPKPEPIVPLPAEPAMTLPETAGESDAPTQPADGNDDDKELAAMVRPAPGTVAKGSGSDHG